MADPKDNEYGIEADWLLETLVSSVNKTAHHDEDGPAVTLLIGGQLVCGNLISAERYHKVVGLPPAAGREESEQEQRDELGPPPRYVHLSNAYFVYGTQSATYLHFPDSFFRARLSRVDAFMPGRLGKATTTEAKGT